MKIFIVCVCILTFYKCGFYKQKFEFKSDVNYETFYILVADTSQNYAALDKKMYRLSQQINSPIDTLDRSYVLEKDLIALPEVYDDEIYAGEYYPRRYPSNFLSLEYINFFDASLPEKTIALISGIYKTEKEAKHALKKLKNFEPNAFKIKASVYVGCMH